MKTVEIQLQRDNANDEKGIVVGILVMSERTVEEGDLIFEVENSKAVQEIRAPSSGILRHSLKLHAAVEFGETIAVIIPAGQSAQGVVEAAAAPKETVSGLSEPRFSRAAFALAVQNGLSASDFNLDFITTDDVREKLGANRPAATPVLACPSGAPERVPGGRSTSSNPIGIGSPIATQPHKLREIRALARGAGSTLLSVLGTELGALRDDRPANYLLKGKITDIIIYEASRLMPKYKKLNAACNSESVQFHDGVNAGVAMDEGGRLVVYGIEDSDRRTLQEIGNEIETAAERYVTGKLTGEELTRATFTVTDLSFVNLSFIFPLLPEGQSSIIGISRNAAREFSLFLGFDHRITEGREAGQFLQELRERVLASSNVSTVETAITCSICGSPPKRGAEGHLNLGLLKLRSADGKDVLCCATCWRKSS